MAATQNLYKKFVEHLAKGDIALKASGGASVKCALLLNTYTPNMSTDEVLGDVSAYEVSADGTGYTAGRSQGRGRKEGRFPQRRGGESR